MSLGASSLNFIVVFFFSSRRRHTRLSGDWSSECALPISFMGQGLGGYQHVIGADGAARLLQRPTQLRIGAIGWHIECQYFDGGQNGMHLMREAGGVALGGSEAQLGRHDDRRAYGRLSNLCNLAGHNALRMAYQVGEDVDVEQVTRGIHRSISSSGCNPASTSSQPSSSSAGRVARVASRPCLRTGSMTRRSSSRRMMASCASNSNSRGMRKIGR